MCILYNVTGWNTRSVITTHHAGIRQNRKLKSEYQNRKAKKYVFGFLFHPFFDAKNGWSLRNMPTCCSAQTESKLNPSLITRSPKLSAEQNGERRPWK